MGKKRIATIEGKEEKSKKDQKDKKPQKVRIPGLKGGERVVAVQTEPVPKPEIEKDKKEEEKKTPKKISKPKIRGKKYKAAQAKIDPHKTYSLKEAVRLVKNTSITSFDGSVEVHFKVSDSKTQGQVKLPYLKAKKKKVEIASEKTLKKLEKGKIDFDVLLATPSFMPKLAKYAKILGPKGLMPNPKQGTILKNPKKEVGKFEEPLFSFKTEKEQPLIHTVIGKVSQKEKELEENFKTLVKAIGPHKIKKAVLTSTMGPGIKLNLSSLD